MKNEEIRIVEACEAIAKLLLDKREQYGDSVANPLRIFSNANPIEQLNTSIDHKLSRVLSATDDEDTLADLIGYLILLKIERER